MVAPIGDLLYIMYDSYQGEVDMQGIRSKCALTLIYDESQNWAILTSLVDGSYMSIPRREAIPAGQVN